MATFIVLLDSDVIFGVDSADLLLTLGAKGCYRPHWSRKILDDAKRNVILKRPNLDPERIALRIESMNQGWPQGLVEPPQELIDAMTNDPGDRHVLAAAVHVAAGTIVSNNGQHFPPNSIDPHNIEVQSADSFVHHHVGLYPDAVQQALIEISARKKRPTEVKDFVTKMKGLFPESLALLEEMKGPVIDW